MKQETIELVYDTIHDLKEQLQEVAETGESWMPDKPDYDAEAEFEVLIEDRDAFWKSFNEKCYHEGIIYEIDEDWTHDTEDGTTYYHIWAR